MSYEVSERLGPGGRTGTQPQQRTLLLFRASLPRSSTGWISHTFVVDPEARTDLNHLHITFLTAAYHLTHVSLPAGLIAD